MRKLLLVFLVLWSLLPALTVSDLLKDVQDKRVRIKSYQSETVTVMESPMIGRRVQQGITYYQYPDLIRTDSFNPRQTVLNISGKTYIISSGHINETQNENALIASFKSPENILDKFDLKLETLEKGWCMTGAPRSADSEDFFSSVYFSRVMIILDSQKNITSITLYDSLAKEVLNVKTIYEEINDLTFPARTEVCLSEAKIKVATEHKHIKLNTPLEPGLFDPEKISKGE